MARLIALDVAVLLPAEVAELARELNAALPAGESQGLTLDADHLPHLTLAQFFAPESGLDRVIELVGAAIAEQRALRMHVSGAAQHGATVWLDVERTGDITALHQQVMDAVREVEVAGGGPDAFVDGDARSNDMRWVSQYRTDVSYAAFRPHITIGHAARPPQIDPFDFDADAVALCHLGRFCTCRQVLARWTLPGI